jgi:hypothetical protein
VDVNVDTRRRSLVVAMIIFRGMMMMLVDVTVFYTAGGKYSRYEQECECTQQVL